MAPNKDSPKATANFLVMRILKNIQRKIGKFERAEDKGDVEGMLLNQLSPEEQSFLQSQSKIEEGAEEEPTSAVLDGISTKDLLKMYDDFRKN